MQKQIRAVMINRQCAGTCYKSMSKYDEQRLMQSCMQHQGVIVLDPYLPSGLKAESAGVRRGAVFGQVTGLTRHADVLV